MGFLNTVTKLARSPQGRKAMDEAKRLAKDPETKRKIEAARERMTQQRKR